MLIKNRQEIIDARNDIADKKARELLLDLIEATIAEADPTSLISKNLSLNGRKVLIGEDSVCTEDFADIFVIGAGKAGKKMAEGLNLALEAKITSGLLNIPARETSFCGKIELHPASHPIPDHSGVLGAKRILEIAGKAEKNDLVICLLSGGGSSLLPMPAPEIALEDKQWLTGQLLRSGAVINEINTVRKHLSAIKGGLLAKAAFPARLISFILSDVIGDPLDVIASGPTTADKSTFSEAKEILLKYSLWQEASASIKLLIEKGIAGKISETPKPGDACLGKSQSCVIGNNLLMRRAAAKFATRQGLRVCSIEKPFVCDSEKAAQELLDLYSKCRNEISPAKMLLIAGGETTLKVIGSGKGGRAQHLALAFMLNAQTLDDKRFVFAALGSDGIDGPTDAAGAIVDYRSFSEARKQNSDPALYLENQDSHGFFSKAGGLIKTGYSGTNLNDLYLTLIY